MLPGAAALARLWSQERDGEITRVDRARRPTSSGPSVGSAGGDCRFRAEAPVSTCASAAPPERASRGRRPRHRLRHGSCGWSSAACPPGQQRTPGAGRPVCCC